MHTWPALSDYGEATRASEPRFPLFMQQNSPKKCKNRHLFVLNGCDWITGDRPAAGWTALRMLGRTETWLEPLIQTWWVRNKRRSAARRTDPEQSRSYWRWNQAKAKKAGLEMSLRAGININISAHKVGWRSILQQKNTRVKWSFTLFTEKKRPNLASWTKSRTVRTKTPENSSLADVASPSVKRLNEWDQMRWGKPGFRARAGTHSRMSTMWWSKEFLRKKG